MLRAFLFETPHHTVFPTFDVDVRLPRVVPSPTSGFACVILGFTSCITTLCSLLSLALSNVCARVQSEGSCSSTTQLRNVVSGSHGLRDSLDLVHTRPISHVDRVQTSPCRIGFCLNYFSCSVISPELACSHFGDGPSC